MVNVDVGTEFNYESVMYRVTKVNGEYCWAGKVQSNGKLSKGRTRKFTIELVTKLLS